MGLKEWTLMIGFTDVDVENQISSEMYDYLVERGLIDEFVRRVSDFVTAYISENFDEIVGTTMTYVAKQLVIEQVRP